MFLNIQNNKILFIQHKGHLLYSHYLNHYAMLPDLNPTSFLPICFDHSDFDTS